MCTVDSTLFFVRLTVSGLVQAGDVHMFVRQLSRAKAAGLSVTVHVAGA